MIFGHESEAMRTFVGQEETIRRERLHARKSEGDAEIGDYWDTVVSDGIHENEGRVVMDIDYESTQSRNFFPCKSEDYKLMVMLRKVQHAREISRNQLEGRMLFVGEDGTAFCIDYKLDLKIETKENTNNRLVLVHSLHHGTFEISITDYV